MAERTFRVLADLRDGQIDLRTDWRLMPPDMAAAAVDALQHHLGCDHAPMAKAAPMKERPDPRYSELITLIEQARADWEAWGQLLTRRVLELLDAGKLLPMTFESEGALRALFASHHQALLVALNGPGDMPARQMAALQRAGLVSPQVAQRGGYVELAYRLGKGLDALKAHERPVPDRAASLAETISVALRPPLTAADRAAIDWAKTRAGELITRPVETARGRIAVRLNDEELGGIRQAVAAHIEAGDRAKNLKHDVAQALQGTNLQNDLDRIARTELAFAHNYGAYQKLRETAKALGDDDPQVYRVASINACEHCRRLWGPPTAPVVYRLTVIEAWEAQGGNVGIPSASWGPTIGPVHPNCMCSPLALYRPEFKDAISRAADRVLKTFGRF